LGVSRAYGVSGANAVSPDANVVSVRPFSPTFFESSGTGGPADHANGDSVAVSRERCAKHTRRSREQSSRIAHQKSSTSEDDEKGGPTAF